MLQTKCNEMALVADNEVSKRKAYEFELQKLFSESADIQQQNHIL